MRTRYGDAARTVGIGVVQEAVAAEAWLGGRREDLFLKSDEGIQLGRHFGRWIQCFRVENLEFSSTGRDFVCV